MSDPTTPGAENAQPVEPGTPEVPAAQAPAPEVPAAPAAPAAPAPAAAPVAEPAIAPPAYTQPPAYAAAPPAPPAPGAPVAGAPYPGQPQQQPPMNALAIVALIGGILMNVVGIICGHIALAQIKRTGERGRGMALAGTIIGYVSLAASIIGIIFFFVFAGLAVQAASSSASSSLSQLEDATTELEESLSDQGIDADTTGDRSPEFCAALDAAYTITDPDTAEFSPEEVAAYRELAKVESPNMDVYKDFAGVIETPEKILTDPNANDLYERFISAWTEDNIACM